MTTELLIKIAIAVFTIISALISAYVIPWIKANIGADKLAEIAYYTELAVRSAEQLFTPEEWAKKKEYVYTYISGLVSEYGLKLSPADIDILIEGIVNEVKKANL